MDSLRSTQTDLLRMAITRCTMMAKARIRLDANPLDLLLAPGGGMLRIQDPAVVAFLGLLRLEGLPLDFKVLSHKPEGDILCLVVGRGEAQVCVPIRAWGYGEGAQGMPDVVLRDILRGLIASLTTLRRVDAVPVAPPLLRIPSLAVVRRDPLAEVPHVSAH